MKLKGNYFSKHSPGQLLSIGLMAFCLCFLTCINYFQYPDQQQKIEKSSFADEKDSSSFPPSGPTEEKSSGGGLTILEEFLHEANLTINFGTSSPALVHQVEDSGRILAFHGELVSPPPDL